MTLAVRAYDFAQILDSAPQGIKILSLDCFDTLLWRNCNLPIDVFADLPFPGSGMEARAWAETRARRAIPLLQDRIEVSIEEIYAHGLPAATEAQRAMFVDAELEAEARHCYAFEPTVALMKAAKARGLKIIIVSDTYLSEPQLRTLITRAAGEEVVAMIDRIFCSSEYGRPKAAGLFVPVLAKLGVSPATILHCGDNLGADVTAPSRLGIHCCHLEQFDGESEQRLRLEASAASIVDPATRVSVPAYQPHRAAIALRRDDTPTTMLGHDVLGPIFHAFAGWLHAEAVAQEARTGKPTKLLFLLRDGYLPAQAYLARYPEGAATAAMVEISRLTAARASMTDRAAIESYILPELPVGSAEVFARHLHFDPAEAKRLAALPKAQFARHIVKPDVVRQIAAKSRHSADKLIAHLRSHGVAEGDSVMLVDLGYNGSVQNLIEPMLRDRMDLTVTGRYLLLRETFDPGLDKAGFIDPGHHDRKILHALSESIAILEQLCTLPQGSAIDYEKDGTPIREDAGLKAAQSVARNAVQAACLDFVRAADQGVIRPALSDTPDARRRMATASLARLLFLPVESEVAVLGDFNHDVNMGTDDTFKFVDVEAAAQGLRRRGLFYIKNAMRMYLPGELRQHGLPINLSIFASRRFGLDLRKPDFDVGAIKLPVMLMNASGGHAIVDVDAVPTIEGYYQALVPIGAAQFTAGIQFGRIADWVQIEETSFHLVDEFLDPKQTEDSLPAPSISEGLEDVGDGLMHCTGGDAAFLLVPPPSGTPAGEPLLLSVVFRPVVLKRTAEAEARAAA
ncbi:HAD family hydrolase [Sphingobium nicotianae]|uniref:Hydrolase n=1 Tax=Sphingobium nicotianae TaxID=2782607 RepID=A0A9X1DFT5_9SPHN|nr:HAD family hydrolase [Sphingobium nicotianae]MBT2188748.1 hydrolase [Sphingobium nicotianae]